jgi:hypothetical protein
MKRNKRVVPSPAMHLLPCPKKQKISHYSKQPKLWLVAAGCSFFIHPILFPRLRRAKAATTDRDVRPTWILFGDPAASLKY